VPLRLFNVRGPFAVVVDRIDAQAKDLAVPRGKFRLESGHVAKFRRTDWREIFRVRKQDGPAVADPLVELNRPLRGFGYEIGGFVVDS
jgi:hypothetical protein